MQDEDSKDTNKQAVGNKYDPFSPANTGLPIIIKDASGKRIGNVWSPSKNNLGEALKSLEKGESGKIYFDSVKGSFTNSPVSTMSYKDGKIKLNVSKDVANSSWYKQVYEGEQFKGLASAYALDPTGKTKLEVLEKGEKKEKTINDLLEGYAKDLEENSIKYKGNVDVKIRVSRATNGALNLTDEDIAIMGNYQNFSKDNFSDTDAIFLPTSLQDYFKEYASYNAESGTISARDFYEEFFNLNKEPTEGVKEIIKDLGGGELAGSDADILQQIGESDKDYAIDLVRVKTSQQMLDIVERATFYSDSLSDEEKATLTTEYAKCFSLNKAMTKDTPNTDSWTGFNLAVQSFGVGLADGAVTAGESLEHFWSQVVSNVADGGVRVASAFNAPFSWFHELFDNLFTGGWDKMTQNTRAMYEHFDEWYTENTNEESMLGEMRDSIKDLGRTISNREDWAAKLFEGAERDLAQSYANAEAMMRIGRIGGLIITQIVATNPIGQVAGDLATLAIAEGASVLTTGYRFATLANMASTFSALATTANTALQATQYMKILNTIKLVSGVIGFTANMYMQGVVDTFVENPALTDALLYGETDENISEFQNQLRMNILWNTVGEFAPGFIKGVAGGTRKGASKATNWFAQNTRFGAFTQASLRKTVNFFTLRGRKAYEGIAEFMTDKFPLTKQGEYTIEGGEDVPFSGKLTPAKRMQSLRKDIIKIQEDIEKAKILGGDGVMSNAKAIDDLIQTRIDLEQVLGTTKKLAIAQAKQAIIKNAGLDIEVAEVSEYTARLTQLSKKMKQTNLPGSFSKETGDYINDLFNQRRLLNKQTFLEANDKALSKTEKEGLDILSERISKYEASLPSEYSEAYKTAVKNYMEANYRFYYKLNNYLASDAGGNIISKEALDKMRANSQYGSAGEMYMPLYAVGGFKGAGDLENFLKNPASVVQEGTVKTQVETFSRKTFSDEVTYLDPNYTRDLVVNAYAQVTNAANMSDVVKRAGMTTSVPTDSQGNILKTQKDVAKAKDALYKDLEQKFESSFRENLQFLGPKTLEATKGNAKDYYKTVKRRAQRTVNDILGLNSAGLKTYASTLNSAEIEQISKVYSLPAYSRKIRTRAELDTMYNSLSNAQKKIVDKTLQGNELTVRSWNDAVANNNLDTLLSRQYIMDDKAILGSAFYKNMVGEARAAELEADEALALRTAKAEVTKAEEGIKAGKAVEPDLKKINAQKDRDFKKVVRGTITEAVDGTVAALADNPYLEQLIKEYEKLGISSDVAKEYIILQWLYDNSKKGGVLQDIAFRYYNAPSKVSEIKISTDAAKGYSRKFRDAAESIIESKLNKTVKKINEQGVEGLVDLEATATRVDKYFKDITDMWGNKQIVEAWDRENGRFIYYQVDRDTYNLVTNYPTFKKANGFAKLMARINSIARVGQITIRAASLVTQGFKDTFNAVVLGGWDELLLDNPDTYKKIAEYIGPETVEAFRKEMTPNAWKDFLAMAEWQGLSVEEAIAKSEVNDELLKMKIEGGSGTSAGYFSYRSLYEPTDQATLGAAAQIEAAKDTWTGSTKARWKEAYNKARVAWYNSAQNGNRGLGSRIYDTANILHNARETFLRKQVYRQNFMEALDAGKSLAQARNYAQYFMENATTKFSRGFAWGDNIIRSIPYFGAMLNGASSMVRLLEVDPLGVMTRFTANLVLPVVGLTAMSLQDPRDAEIYRNIPEYEKESNLHWVVNGQVETIPLPEELAKFILPIRHAIESIAGVNKNAWHELLLNDLLNMPVVPLNAVMMLDDKKINGDPSVMDRISALAMDMFNTLAPNAARTMYIARTGKDPYTGEDYGRMRWYQDENGEYQLMAESEYGFANDMANLFKSWGWGDVNAVMAEALFSSFFGAGSLDLAEGIRDLAASVQQGSPDITALIAPSMERARSVLTGTARTDERQAMIAWYALYNEVKEKKNELLAPDGKLAKYSQDIDMAKDQNTLAKKTELYDSEVNNWQNYVLDKVKEYNSMYGDYFTRSKFASAISMMTANLSINRTRNSDDYYNARAFAIETMYDAGFTSPSDNSIFGYVQRDMNTGRVAIKYTDPLVVSLTGNLFWYQGDEAVQMLKDTIELSGLKDKYNDVIYPAYDKYMDAKDYKSANDLAAKWDVELMKTIKPIIDEYTVGNLLNKSTALDLLDNYILVPNTTEAIGKGKYYSSKTGLNKRRGFAGAYAKKIYNALNKENKK